MYNLEHTERIDHELANRSLAQVIFETGLFVLIALTALVGNSCVLFVFYKTPRLRSVTSYYIIILAIADISMTLLVMTTTIGAASSGRDIIGRIAGQVTGMTGYTLVFGSLQTTSLIAINRFFCVVKPTLYRKYFKPKSALIMIGGVWIFSISNPIVFYTSGMATFEFFPARFVYLLAFRDSSTDQVFAIISFFTFCGFPMSLTAICYWKVYKVVKGHNATVSSTLNGNLPGNRSPLSKEEIDITKSVLALVCGFVLCWIPCSTVVLLSIYFDLPRHADMVFIYTAFLSSAINPIIFNIFNKPFRKQMKLIFWPSSLFHNPVASESASHSTNKLAWMTTKGN